MIPPNHPANIASWSSLLLPCHPRRRNDEILSSWLLKIASENIVPAKKLLERIDISRRYLDSMDSKDPRLVSIANAVGLSKNEVVPALPSSLYGLFGESHFSPRDSCWLRCQDGTLSGVKSQYCPMCIREFGYYQLSWTITLHTCCLRHRCFLQEDCPHCGKPFRNALQSFNSYISDPEKQVQRCGYCAGSLDDVPVELADDGTLELVYILSSISKKPTCYGYFNVLRELMRFICGRSDLAQYARSHVLIKSDQNVFRNGNGDLPDYKHLDAKSRALILQAAVHLFKDWPFCFVDMMKSLDHVSRRAKYRFLPGWYRHVMFIAEARSYSLREGYREEFLDIASREQWMTAVKFADSLESTRVFRKTKIESVPWTNAND